MQYPSLEKLSHCNNSTTQCFFEAHACKARALQAFFLLEGLLALLVAAMMAAVLGMLVSYTAAYSARVCLLHGAIETACSALDAVVYGHGPMGSQQQVSGDGRGDYTVVVNHTPNQYTPDAVTARVMWQFQGRQEQIELASVVRKA